MFKTAIDHVVRRLRFPLTLLILWTQIIIGHEYLIPKLAQASLRLSLLKYFNLLMATLATLAFVKATWTCTGFLDKTAKPERIIRKLNNDITLQVQGTLCRFKVCKVCNKIRPPRTVHCNICNLCIARFDHHCPWINNCVGLMNYRSFYTFLVSSSSLVIIYFAISIADIVRTWRSCDDDPIDCVVEQCSPSILMSVFVFAIDWFVVLLLCYHTFLIFLNCTTYENLKAVYYNKVNPWHRGVRRNIMEILFYWHGISSVTELVLDQKSKT